MKKYNNKSIAYFTERDDQLEFPTLKRKSPLEREDLIMDVSIPVLEEPRTRDDKFKDEIIKEKTQREWKSKAPRYNEIYPSRGPYYHRPDSGQGIMQHQIFRKVFKKSYNALKGDLNAKR